MLTKIVMAGVLVINGSALWGQSVSVPESHEFRLGATHIALVVVMQEVDPTRINTVSCGTSFGCGAVYKDAVKTLFFPGPSEALAYLNTTPKVRLQKMLEIVATAMEVQGVPTIITHPATQETVTQYVIK